MLQGQTERRVAAEGQPAYYLHRATTPHRTLDLADFRSVIDYVGVPIFAHDPLTGAIDLANRAFLKACGYAAHELAELQVDDLVHGLESKLFLTPATSKDGQLVDGKLQTRAGDFITVTISTSSVSIDGKAKLLSTIISSACSLSESTELDLVRQSLLEMLEATSDFVGIADLNGNPVYVNDAGRQMLGLEDRPLKSESAWAKKIVEHAQADPTTDDIIWQGDGVIEGNAGTVPVSQVIIAHRDAAGVLKCVSTIARDNSVHKDLEGQLRQAQKMEAVGRLTGGVAHDFNNLLTGIRGFTDLLLLEEQVPERRSDLVQIQELTEMAADLTRQLLSFSRHQPIVPRVVNINQLVTNTFRILQRLIGEDIDLICETAEQLWNVRVDPAHIEQILFNLAVNARDAMPSGGRILIETQNIDLRDPSCSKKYDLEPGEYVMLGVSDTGCGMDEGTRARIFEPFFTTKLHGKGTGLGLANVQSIVKQHGGKVSVFSEPGKGTTFQVFLPRVDSSTEPTNSVRFAGQETILVVEDDHAVRHVLSRLLSDRGYTVHCAADPEQATKILLQHSDSIRLLLTDVDLPGLSGPELYNNLVVIHPELKAIYMSGQSDEVVLRRRNLNRRTAFLQKPFESQSLLRMIRDVLDGR